MARSISLFVGCAVIAFTVASPQVAKSATRNISASGCKYDAANALYTCSIPTDDTTFTVADLDAAYFDYYCQTNKTVNYQLRKASYTGSLYSDVGTEACTSGGARDKYLAAVNVKTNPSVYDYLFAQVSQGIMIGVQARF